MKTFLSDKTVSNETLFEQLNTATNSVNECKKKLQSASRTARINEITSSDVSQNNNKTEKSKKENPIANEMREINQKLLQLSEDLLLIKVLAASVKLRLIRNQID